MGKMISTLSSYATRPFRNYNVVQRAHKIIDRNLPKSAPKHPSTVKLLEDHSRNNPQLVEELQQKDELLLKHLKDVYVTATEPTQIAHVTKQLDSPMKKRPLPERPELRPSFRKESKVMEDVPAPAPVGKITLLDASRLLTEYDDTDAVDSVQLAAIVEKYRLEPEVVRNILSYYSPMQLYVPGHPEFGVPSEAPASTAIAWKRYLAIEKAAYESREASKQEEVHKSKDNANMEADQK